VLTKGIDVISKQKYKLSVLKYWFFFKWAQYL